MSDNFELKNGQKSLENPTGNLGAGYLNDTDFYAIEPAHESRYFSSLQSPFQPVPSHSYTQEFSVHQPSIQQHTDPESIAEQSLVEQSPVQQPLALQPSTQQSSIQQGVDNLEGGNRIQHPKLNKNGEPRKSREPRGTLRRWKDDEENTLALLGIVWACGELGIQLPFNMGAQMVDLSCTGSALQQAILKMRERLNKAGHQIPKLKMQWPTKPSQNTSVRKPREFGKLPRRKASYSKSYQSLIVTLKVAYRPRADPITQNGAVPIGFPALASVDDFNTSFLPANPAAFGSAAGMSSTRCPPNIASGRGLLTQPDPIGEFPGLYEEDLGKFGPCYSPNKNAAGYNYKHNRHAFMPGTNATRYRIAPANIANTDLTGVDSFDVQSQNTSTSLDLAEGSVFGAQYRNNRGNEGHQFDLDNPLLDFNTEPFSIPERQLQNRFNYTGISPTFEQFMSRQYLDENNAMFTPDPGPELDMNFVFPPRDEKFPLSLSGGDCNF